MRSLNTASSAFDLETFAWESWQNQDVIRDKDGIRALIKTLSKRTSNEKEKKFAAHALQHMAIKGFLVLRKS